MLRFALCALLVGAAVAPLAAQMQNNTPPAGTDPMGASGGGYGAGWWSAGPGGPPFWPSQYRSYAQARPDQVRIGNEVHSVGGPFIGRVAYSDSRVAVVKSSHWALRLPVKAFGISKKNGLLLKLSPSSFDHLAKLHGARVG